MDWVRENLKWLVPTAIVVIVGIVLGAIFIPKYSGPGENCVFINESTNLHKEYLVEVTGVDEYDQIEILLNKGDVETHSLYSTDTHFVAVTVSIKRANTTNSQEDHIFDKDDFKLKDHTGVKLKNFYFGSVKDGFVLSESDFATTKATEDYHYIDQAILPREEKEFVIYFEVSDEYSVYDTIMVLEVDFFTGIGNNKGTDIVLAKRSNEG